MNAPKKGRPAVYGQRLKSTRVTLDTATLDKARALGNGSISAGIRASLAASAVPVPNPEPKDEGAGQI